MFFILAICSTLGYAIQSTLMYSVYRRMDPMTAIAARGISLGISGLPLLLLASRTSVAQLLEFAPLMLFAACTAAIGNACDARSAKHLEVGVSATIRLSLQMLLVALLGVIFFQEHLSVVEMSLIAVILIGNAALNSQRTSSAVPEPDFWLGVRYAFGFSFFLAIAVVAMSAVSRGLDPFIAAFSWEFVIGLVATLMLYLRKILFGVRVDAIPIHDFQKILLYSSPTVIGTGCYAIAVHHGPVAIVSAIVSAGMVGNVVLAQMLYDERLSRKQWAAIAVVVLAVVGFKLVR